MFEPCPISAARCRLGGCDHCVGGRVVSEAVIEEMGREIEKALEHDALYVDWHREATGMWSVRAARQASRVVLEHMEDNERTTG